MCGSEKGGTTELLNIPRQFADTVHVSGCIPNNGCMIFARHSARRPRCRVNMRVYRVISLPYYGRNLVSGLAPGFQSVVAGVM